jgi:hypothetical protein
MPTSDADPRLAVREPFLACADVVHLQLPTPPRDDRSILDGWRCLTYRGDRNLSNGPTIAELSEQTVRLHALVLNMRS